ncbi:hypothetical protein LXL04_003543 [Taraxacum kok-saghyz]
METENQRQELEFRTMIPLKTLAGSLNLSSVSSGYMFSVGYRKIQSGLQWKLARMNQSEVDEFLRIGGTSEDESIGDQSITKVRNLNEALCPLCPCTYDALVI